jgi:23S rRNA U2552 (ribose-2'-O)-methylase RlmE/FtsJ
VRFLEIGVSKGGSMQMWRKYFGKEAVIFGIDIEKNCLEFQGINGEVRIGSQDDPDFLNSVVAEMGGVDVILDDGSHVMKHIMTSLSCLLPQLEDGGIYMIEDLHTAYWRNFGGGLRSKMNFFNIVRSLTDDMHSWYHQRSLKHQEISKHCRSIHIYDSIVVIEKGVMYPPVHSKIV